MDALTGPQLRVLAQTSLGLDRHEVGGVLHYAPSTVAEYLRAVRQKLGARNTVHAVAIAYERGLLPMAGGAGADPGAGAGGGGA